MYVADSQVTNIITYTNFWNIETHQIYHSSHDLPSYKFVIDTIHVAGGCYDGRHILMTIFNTLLNLRKRSFYVKKKPTESKTKY